MTSDHCVHSVPKSEPKNFAQFNSESTMATIMTKEEPLIRQIVRSRALKSNREGSASPIRGRASKGGVFTRSLSQPPLRVSRSEKPPQTVYTLQILPYSLVYPQVSPLSRPRDSFSSASQPDLTKMATPTQSRFTTPPSTTNVSRCVSPFSIISPVISRCESPVAAISPLNGISREATPLNSISRAATPFSGNLIDINNNENFCQCPTRKGRQACFSSLCCEICKLFPANNDERNNQDFNHVNHGYNHVNNQLNNNNQHDEYFPLEDNRR